MGNFNRDNRGGGRGRFPRRDFDRDRGDRDHGRRQMFKATCSNCGKACELPFRPTNDKPVYCSDCFEKMGGGRRDRNDRPRFNDRRPGNGDRHDGGQNRQFEELNKKLDKIISLLQPKTEEPVVITPEKPAVTTEPVKEPTATAKEEPKVEEPVKEAKKTTAKKAAPKKASKTKK